jgi:hypothetical protein
MRGEESSIIFHLKIHKISLYQKSLPKYQQTSTLMFSPFYNPTDSSNCLTALDISTLVSQFVLLLVMLLHLNFLQYLLLCQVTLQSLKSIYNDA